ncbi:MAG: glycosyltransferase family 2 protein [Eubacterium sp.]|nr:glycosyltransferase family 2 protein [Eubacterium sp.]
MSYFSILIPVYNQVGKMDRCIESVKAQTFTDFEVIMVDDGSTDGSYEMLREFEASDDRFHAVRYEENGSLIKARYTGMERASGEVVLFLDSDDYLLDVALERIHDRFEETDPDIVCFGFVTEPDGEKVAPVHIDDIIEAIHKKTIYPTIWKNAYKRTVTDRLVETTKPFYCNMGEDVYFSHVLFTFGKKIDYVDDILYYYQRDTGMSSPTGVPEFNPSRFRKYITDATQAATHTVDFIEKYNPEKSETTKKAVSNMSKFVLMQHFMFEKDYRIIVQYIMELKNMGCEELFDYACNISLKRKVYFDSMNELEDQ